MAAHLSLIAADKLMATSFAPPKFLVPGLVTEGLTLLAGRPKLGKSWLAMNISLAVASGLPVLGRDPCEPGDVLHLALEDGPRRLQQRLGLMLGPRQPPSGLSFATTCPGLDAGGADAIAGWIRAAASPRLIVVDVFQRIRSKGTGGRLYADDYAAVTPLKEIADEAGIGVLVVTHCRKSDASNDDPLDAVSATTGLTAAADSILILDRASSGTTLYGRGRDVPEFDLAMSFDPQRGLWTALGERAEIDRSESRNAIMRVLRDAGIPMSPKAIADASGVDHDVTKKLCGRLVEAGHLIRAKRGEYALPPGEGR